MTPSDDRADHNEEDERAERRLHPLSILFEFGAKVRSFALPSVAFLVTAGFAGFAWQLLLLPVTLPYLVTAIARYVSFRYRYEPGELVIRTGTLFRNERHIPYSRIQNIDGVQNVAHRLFKVMEVRVETGGGQEAEATMNVLPIADFEEMRRRVFERRQEAPAADGAAEALPEPPKGRGPLHLLHLPTRELMRLGLIQNRGFVVIAAVVGLLWELGPMNSFLGSIFDREGFGVGPPRDAARNAWRSLVSPIFDGDWLPAVQGVTMTVAAVLLFLVVVRLVSMVWTVVRLHEFRLTRTGEDLRTEYGLLTRVNATIPLRRIQTLTILEGPLHRLTGRVSVKADTAGGHREAGQDGDEKPAQREPLAPILRRAELPALLREVLPGLDLDAVEWQPAPARAFRREIKGWVLVALGSAIPLSIALRGWVFAALPLLLLWAWMGARGTLAHQAWATTGDAVLYRDGWIWRHLSIAPFEKIQAVTLRESPRDRHAAMARLKVDTAGAGDLSQRVEIPYLLKETAAELQAMLALQANRNELRW